MNTAPDKIDQVEAKEEWLDQDTATRNKLEVKREAARAKNVADRYWNMTLKDIHTRCEQMSIFESNAFAEAIKRIVLRGKK